MSTITETISADGVRSSPRDHGRMSRPRPGDLVEWPDGELGRIDSDTSYGHFSVCSDLGSCFLRPDGTTSISGGPFFAVNPNRLEPTWRTAPARFWNWGDNSPGAGKGVDFTLERPVFRYAGAADAIYTHRVDS